MTHVRFQHDMPEGSIEVQFNLEFTGQNQSVSDEIFNIHIHCTFNSGLPRRPELRFHEGEWKFYAAFKTQEDGEVVEKYQYFNDSLSKELIQIIFEKRDEYTPKFKD